MKSKVLLQALFVGCCLASSATYSIAISGGTTGVVTSAQADVADGKYVEPVKCVQKPGTDEFGNGPCLIECTGPNGETLCRGGYNRCDGGCKPASFTSAVEEVAESFAEATKGRFCKTIPRMCCIQIDVNHHDLVWHCFDEPADGCGNMTKNPDPRRAHCDEGPHTD